MENLEKIARLLRYYSIVSAGAAGSGHPTSSLSAADIMAVLFFGGFLKFDTKNPKDPQNDRVIFSKGHASTLFYSLWALAGEVTEEELMTYRKFGSPLEGHPTMEFKFTEAPTGSLGQGLSIGVGIALSGVLDNSPFKTYVLMGDSEMAEGSVWEAIEIASFYKLNNLVGIVDVNRLGQSRETMYGHDTRAYEKRISSFGWETIVIDGHNLPEISEAFKNAEKATEKPVMIIAKTLKGKGVPFLEDKNGFHGKALPQEKMGEALASLGDIDKTIRGKIKLPPKNILKKNNNLTPPSRVAQYNIGESVATRKAYGQTLADLGLSNSSLVVLDGETSNSTYSEIFAKDFPERYFEMFIAEQNMASAAVGLSTRGKIPFASTFAAFWTRAYDQIRMAGVARANVKFVGSHAGVSIGEDGPSQMALEDIAMFRSLNESVVLYPSDANATKNLVEKALNHEGLVYLRTTRMETPVIYSSDEVFEIGGSKTIKSSAHDKVTVVASGITLHEAIKAHGELSREGINIRVIDLYSVKPIDSATLEKAAEETDFLIVVEDHREEGGICEAVRSSLVSSEASVHSLAVRKPPKSGKPEELLRYEEIDSEAIVKKVKELIE